MRGGGNSPLAQHATQVTTVGLQQAAGLIEATAAVCAAPAAAAGPWPPLLLAPPPGIASSSRSRAMLTCGLLARARHSGQYLRRGEGCVPCVGGQSQDACRLHAHAKLALVLVLMPHTLGVTTGGLPHLKLRG